MTKRYFTYDGLLEQYEVAEALGNELVAAGWTQLYDGGNDYGASDYYYTTGIADDTACFVKLSKYTDLRAYVLLYAESGSPTPIESVLISGGDARFNGISGCSITGIVDQYAMTVFCYLVNSSGEVSFPSMMSFGTFHGGNSIVAEHSDFFAHPYAAESAFGAGTKSILLDRNIQAHVPRSNVLHLLLSMTTGSYVYSQATVANLGYGDAPNVVVDDVTGGSIVTAGHSGFTKSVTTGDLYGPWPCRSYVACWPSLSGGSDYLRGEVLINPRGQVATSSSSGLHILIPGNTDENTIIREPTWGTMPHGMKMIHTIPVFMALNNTTLAGNLEQMVGRIPHLRLMIKSTDVGRAPRQKIRTGDNESYVAPIGYYTGNEMEFAAGVGAYIPLLGPLPS